MGEWEGKLANNGETILLSYSASTPIIRLTYDDKRPWPEKADGKGFSLEPEDVAGTGVGPKHWRASSAVHGNPGE